MQCMNMSGTLGVEWRAWMGDCGNLMIDDSSMVQHGNVAYQINVRATTQKMVLGF